jgi:hypothetical protein
MSNEFYNLKRIDQRKALYNMIIGQRSNGKTYAVIQEKCVKAYFKNGARLALIRRFKEDLAPRNIGELLTPHLPLIEKLSKGRFNSIKYYNREFWFCRRNDKDEIEDISETSVIKCFSLNTWESAKGADNGFFETILFDEFLTRGFYLKDEFVIFTQILSSIIRNRDGTTIYMLANTVNKYCPYFAEMGITNIDKMEQGTIDLYRYGNSDLTVAVEYCADSGASKKINKYFAFDNPRLQMITTGSWETDSYPHCPVDYEKEDILYHAFIDFSGALIHGEVVRYIDTYTRNKHLFVFFYKQTKEMELDEVEVLYTDRADSNVLHCHSARERPTKRHELFINLISTHNDFYCSNEVGEIVRNWKMINGLINVR